MDTHTVEAIFIRQATENDVTAIDAIERSVVASPWSRAAISGALSDEHALNLAATAPSGEMRGYLFGTLAADELSILYAVTHPLFRRRRIGRRLVEAAIEQARKRGARNAYLEVRSKNLAARGLYAALGFTRQALRKKYYADNEDDALVMVKRLY